MFGSCVSFCFFFLISLLLSFSSDLDGLYDLFIICFVHFGGLGVLVLRTPGGWFHHTLPTCAPVQMCNRVERTWLGCLVRTAAFDPCLGPSAVATAWQQNRLSAQGWATLMAGPFWGRDNCLQSCRSLGIWPCDQIDVPSLSRGEASCSTPNHRFFPSRVMKRLHQPTDINRVYLFYHCLLMLVYLGLPMFTRVNLCLNLFTSVA